MSIVLDLDEGKLTPYYYYDIQRVSRNNVIQRHHFIINLYHAPRMKCGIKATAQ